MINDVSCLKNPALARIAARYGAALCIMHDRRQSAERDLMNDKLTGLVAAAETRFGRAFPNVPYCLTAV